MTNKIEAAIFDVDGMLLDTREFIFSAYEHTLATHGYPVPDRTTIAQQVGRSLPDCYTAFAPDGELELLCDTHHTFQAEQLHIITGYDGLIDMLDILHNKELKLGAFSSRKGNLLPSLENAGILNYFGVVIQGGEVIHHKPHPEGIFKALGVLSTEPVKAAMLGDAAVDIEAGKAANVNMTIGITHGFGTRKELEAAKPDYIVNKLEEIPPLLLA